MVFAVPPPPPPPPPQFQLRKKEFLDALPASVLKGGKVIPVRDGVAKHLEVGWWPWHLLARSKRVASCGWLVLTATTRLCCWLPCQGAGSGDESKSNNNGVVLVQTPGTYRSAQVLRP